MKKTLFTLALTLVCSCAEKDTTAPPAPVVNPIESPTPKLKVSVTGSAEFGATVKIAGGASDVTTTADKFTALWRAEVEFNKDVTNSLSVTATDAAGNVSEATLVTVEQSSPKASSIKLSLTSPLARAGELVGMIARVQDQYGNEMPDAPVTFGSTPALAATFTLPGSMPAITKPEGVIAGSHQFVAFDLSAVKASDYVFQIKATSGTVSDTQPVTIRPAAGNSFSKLAWAPLGTQLTIVAGQDAAYTYEVIDLYGNVTTGPISAFTNAPGAMVVEDGISGAGKITRANTAGTYTAAFYIAGVGQKGSLNLSIGTAPAAFVDLTASATLTSPNTPVKLFARVRDTFGNPIGCTTATAGDVTFTTTGTATAGPTPSATTCFNGAFQATVTFAAEDNYAITATHQPTGAMATSSSVFITVLNFDNTPPVVAISNVTVNGVVCTPASRPTAPGCDTANNDWVEFDVTASDNSALAQVAYSIFFESTQRSASRTVFVAANQATATIHFRFQVRSNAIEVSPLVAMAMDRAGNMMNSAAVAFFINNGVALGGRTLTVAVSSPLLNGPQDIVLDSTGALYVVNGGNNQLLVVPSGGFPQVYANNVSAEFLVRAPSGTGERIFLSDLNGERVRSFDPVAAGPVQTWASFNTGNGGNSQGLSVLGALPARGWVDATGAIDGDRLTLTLSGVAVSYELDSNNNCVAAAGNICAPFVAAGATGAIRAAALQLAINNNASSPVSASIDSGATARVNLFTRAAGESTGATVVAVGTSGGLASSAAALVEGHDADLWVGTNGDNNIRRFLTSGAAPAGIHGTFPVGTRQFGLTVRDVWSTASDRLFDVFEYFVDDANNNQLLGTRTIVTGNGGAFNTSTTNPVTVTNNRFNRLWDVQLLATGCLAVSDDGSGDVFAIDTRDPANNAPVVERIARNLPGPRGLALDAAGNLLIAVDQGNAVVRLSPTSITTDCF